MLISLPDSGKLFHIFHPENHGNMKVASVLAIGAILKTFHGRSAHFRHDWIYVYSSMGSGLQEAGFMYKLGAENEGQGIWNDQHGLTELVPTIECWDARDWVQPAANILICVPLEAP